MMRRKIGIFLVCSLFFFAASINRAYAQEQLKLHFINVGHADATLIEYGNEYILIDGGNVTQTGKNKSDYYTTKLSVLDGVKIGGKTYTGYYDLFKKYADNIQKLIGKKGWQVNKQEAKVKELIENTETSARFKDLFLKHAVLKELSSYQAEANLENYHAMQSYYLTYQNLYQAYLNGQETLAPSGTHTDDTSEIIKAALKEKEETYSSQEAQLEKLKERLQEAEQALQTEEAQETEENPEEVTEGEDEENPSEETETTPESDETPGDSSLIDELKSQIEELESRQKKLAAEIKKLKQELEALEEDEPDVPSNAEVIQYLDAVGYQYVKNLILDYFRLEDNTTSSANDTLRYLKQHGITHLDYMICTHPHEDHVGGLPSILMNFDVDHCLYNGVTTASSYDRIFEIVMRQKAQEGTLDMNVADDETHNTLTLGNGAVRLTELTDTEAFTGKYYNEDQTDFCVMNNQSLVYRLDYAGFSAMLCADAEKELQDQIRKNHPDLVDIDLYRVAHHGYNSYAGNKYRSYSQSGHSANIDFVNAMTPLYSVVSAGTASSSVPSKNALRDLVYSNVYVTTDQVNKVKHEAIIATVRQGSITFTNPKGKTVKPHTKRKLTYTVTASQGMPHKANSKTNKATALHTASAKVTYYNKLVKGEVTIKASPNYYYPQVYYQLSKKDKGYSNNKWIAGRTVQLSGTFYGVVYFKFANAFGESIIRKTDGFNVKPGPSLASLTVSSFKADLYSYDDVKLSWNKVSGAKKYILQYKREDWSAYKALGISKSTSFKRANLADGMGYDFRIKIDGSSTYKKTSAMLYTLKKMAAPSVSQITSTQAQVSLTKIKGADGYQVSIGTSAKKKAIATTTSDHVTVTVKKGQKYTYYVRAYKTVSGKKIYGPWSAGKSFTCT